MHISALPSLASGLVAAPFSSTSPISSTNSASSSTPSSSSSSATQSSNSAEQTFIQLLVTELQSQDPTSPMDPTTMVSQMFSMNQLQQLININQDLSTALGESPTSAASGATAASAIHSNTGMLPSQAAMSPTNAAASYAQQLLTGAF
jgi:flagellar basal-body rod modification protein FlgD